MSQEDVELPSNCNDPGFSVLKNLLRFSKNVEIDICEWNTQTAIQVMYAINKFAPEKRIRLRIDMDKSYDVTDLPDDLIITSVFAYYTFQKL